MSPPQQRNIGMVFQYYPLFPHMTVADNVAFPLRMRTLSRHEASRRIAETLALVQLAHLAGRYPRQLSGGQQQRVALARALVSRPRLLLMDEPLGALDKKLREQMQVEIKRIHRSVGMTVIYVTHDQAEALTMSDLVVVMHQAGSPSSARRARSTRRPPTCSWRISSATRTCSPAKVVAASGAEVTVELANGEIIRAARGEDARSAAIGSRCSIRPEDMSVHTTASGRTGRTCSSAPCGKSATTATHSARCRGRRSDPEGEGCARARRRHRPGRQVRLTWNAAAARILPAADGHVGGRRTQR